MKNYVRTIVAFVIFIVFVSATIITYTSPKYVKAQDRLEYRNSDMGRFSVETEEALNEFNGTSNKSAYYQWHSEVAHLAKVIKTTKILGSVFCVFSLLSLCGVAVMFVKDKKNFQENCCSTDTTI